VANQPGFDERDFGLVLDPSEVPGCVVCPGGSEGFSRLMRDQCSSLAPEKRLSSSFSPLIIKMGSTILNQIRQNNKHILLQKMEPINTFQRKIPANWPDFSTVTNGLKGRSGILLREGDFQAAASLPHMVRSNDPDAKGTRKLQ
jgi:hypothetical protein